MKTYLARYKIVDGEHEHTAYGLIHAEDCNKALEFAESQEHEANWPENEGEQTYFDYGDGLTASRYESLTELNQNQVDVIGELGLAYYMN